MGIIVHSFEKKKCVGRHYHIDKLIRLTHSRFVWANGRAARIGRAIPVCSIGRLLILEALPSRPLDI